MEHREYTKHLATLLGKLDTAPSELTCLTNQYHYTRTPKGFYQDRDDGATELTTYQWQHPTVTIGRKIASQKKRSY